MIVRSVTLENFRNYTLSRADFCPGVNVISGDNAQGKTNLLEAVYYLTSARSFRTRGDRELIKADQDAARVTAEIFSDDREQKLEIRLVRGRKKQITANGVKLRTSSELAGRLSAVLFSPDDLLLVRDGAHARRRMMDLALCQLRPRYAEALTKFQRLYENKTRLLKDFRDDPSFAPLLDEYSASLAECGAILIYYRGAFVKNLAQKAAKIHGDFSGGMETLTMEYKTVKTVGDPVGKKPREIYELLMEHQAAHRRAEIESGLCLSGAHKDDIEIAINGLSARSYASQGQARTASLSMKLAERDIHFEDSGEYPILLLDDVLSELDGDRQSFVLNRILDGQVLITCCEDDTISQRTGGRIIRIESGRVL